MNTSVDARIRPYEPADRAAVHALCCDTAFMGEPIDRFFSDRELFADAVARYYTDHEPQQALVAEAQGRILGYFFGCADTARYGAVMTWQIAPLLVAKGLARGALWQRGTRRFLFGLLRSVAEGKADLPEPMPEYPAHFHINLRSDARGIGLGARLLEQGLARLRETGAHGVYLQTMKQNTRAVEFFRRFGFAPIFESPAPFWPPEVQPITILTMARKW